MTEQDIVDAFNARLAQLPGLGDVAWEGIAYQPKPGTPYLRAVCSGYSKRRVGAGVLGNDQVDGSFTITVVRPADEGRQPAGLQAAQIQAFFAPDVAMTAAGQPLVLLESSEGTADYSGSWVSIPVTVVFTASS